jgi:hypothetical protein
LAALHHGLLHISNGANSLDLSHKHNIRSSPVNRELTCTQHTLSIISNARHLLITSARLKRHQGIVHGYLGLAEHMVGDPELCLFRRFDALNAKNLLYLQAELCLGERVVGDRSTSSCPDLGALAPAQPRRYINILFGVRLGFSPIVTTTTRYKMAFGCMALTSNFLPHYCNHMPGKSDTDVQTLGYHSRHPSSDPL